METEANTTHLSQSYFSEEVWGTVIRFLLEESDAEIPLAAILPETSLRDDLTLTSLQAIEVIMRLEEEYNVTVLDEELSVLKTVGDIARLVASKLGNEAKGPAVT